MKSIDYYSSQQRLEKLVNENGIEILDNEKLNKIKGGISDPPLV